MPTLLRASLSRRGRRTRHAALAFVCLGLASYLVLGTEAVNSVFRADGDRGGVADAPPRGQRSDGRPSLRDRDVPAFPGAEGFGAGAVGGRGGRVMAVTNLRDSGPGSLRACAEAWGRRTCVFRIGGTIETRSKISIKTPYITIAGQTAPGGGITLRSAPDSRDGPVAIKTHDVVIRYLRLRAGPSAEASSQRRSLTVEGGARNVMLDHLSLSWATDQNLTVTDGVRDLTVQWSIISEGLSHSTHKEGEHSKGFLISGKQFTSDKTTGNITVHHNLFAHNRDRNLRHAGHGIVDFVNNVVYNWGHVAFEATEQQTRALSNVVGNYFQRGANSRGHEVAFSKGGSGNGVRYFVAGNIGPNRPKVSDPEENVVGPSDRIWVVEQRFPAPAVTTTSAAQAHNEVLTSAGARIPCLDPVDDRIVADVERGTGEIIDHPAEVGGWPILESGTAPIDSDGDGMPDHWERARGLDPDIDDGAQDGNGDGYTNLEAYLNALVEGVTDRTPCRSRAV